MLSNPELFAEVEATCRERGIIEKFEKENGEKVKGRMMIDLTDVPMNIPLYQDKNEKITAFEASFDFMETRVGIALYVSVMEAASGIWLSGARDDSNPDNIKVWVDFFVKSLLESIAPDGSYGVPIYVFISDHASFSCVPSAPDNTGGSFE